MYSNVPGLAWKIFYMNFRMNNTIGAFFLECVGEMRIIRCALGFPIIVFLQGVLCIFFPSCTCIYSGHRLSYEYK
jgi:hypothetical protein